MTTLRDRIAEYDRQLQQGRCDMRRRLAANDPADGLRDMRDLHRRQFQEETDGMRALGYGFTLLLGVAIGVVLFAWWTAA